MRLFLKIKNIMRDFIHITVNYAPKTISSWLLRGLKNQGDEPCENKSVRLRL